MKKDVASMKRWLSVILIWVSLTGYAQHPFYLQIFDQGKLAMEAGNWRQAAQDLEIAAFGFLEKEPLLAEAYIRLVLTHQALEQPKESAAFLRDANRILEKYPDKPEGLSADLWDAFLVASGRKAPPAPPIPENADELASYVQRYPNNTQAWIALIDAQLVRARPATLRETFANAMAAHPEHAPILAKALIFSMNQDKGRNSEALANKLMILQPDSSLANEVLGGVAAKQGAWQQAAAHFQSVNTPIFSETPQLQAELQDALAQQAEAARQAQEQASQPQPEDHSQSEATPGNDQTAPEQSTVEEASPGITSEPSAEQSALAEDPPPLVEAPETAAITDEQALRAQQVNERVDQLERLVRQESGNPSHKFDLVNAYIDQGSLRKAKKLLARLARRYNNNPRYAETYAHYQYAMGSYQVNVDNLVAFENDLQGASAYYLGMSYYQLGQIPKAKAILQRLDANQFAIPAELLSDSGAPSGGGGFEKPIKQTSQLTKAEALEWLDQQASQGSWAQMNQGLGEIIAKYPTDQDVRFYQGRALMGSGAYDEAMPVFIELVGEGYEANEIFYFAGLAALEKGDMSVASYLLERALSRNSAYASEIQNLLRTRVKPE